jgi:multidrug efflux pump subunit AcrA (membrane-fusion protein)
LKAVKATPLLVPMEVRRSQQVAWLARDGTVVEAGDVVVRFDPYDAEREAADGRADLAAARSRMDKAKADGGKSKRSLSIDQALAIDERDRARTFELTDAELYSRNQIVESALDRALSERKTDVVGRKIEVSERLSRADLALGRVEADKATLKLTQAEQSLRALTIATPHDGLLVLERKWTGELLQAGETLWPGQKIAEIPDLATLEVRAWALEADAAGLQPGLAARVAIEGRPGVEYRATVARVQPVARPKERGSPVKYFETVLALERTDPEIMRPGQKVEASIVLEEAADVVAIPRGALFEKDGRRVVFKEDHGRFLPTEVTVGRNSVSRVVIEKGLAPGDRIALRDPTETASRLAGGRDAGPSSGPAKP